MHGWLLSYSAANLQMTGNRLDTTDSSDGSNLFLGAIWMSGYGPAADAAGNVYFATATERTMERRTSPCRSSRFLVRLTSREARTSRPTAKQRTRRRIGTSARAALCCCRIREAAIRTPAIRGRKVRRCEYCMKWLLNRDDLGDQQSADAGAVWQGNYGGSLWGGPAVYQDAPGTSHVLFGGGGGGKPFELSALGLNPVVLTMQSGANVGCLECRDSGSQPVVSSNATSIGECHRLGAQDADEFRRNDFPLCVRRIERRYNIVLRCCWLVESAV